MPLKCAWGWLVTRPLLPNCFAFAKLIFSDDFLWHQNSEPALWNCSTQYYTSRHFALLFETRQFKRLLFSAACPQHQLLLLKGKSYSSINALDSWVFGSCGEHSQQLPGCVCTYLYFHSINNREVPCNCALCWRNLQSYRELDFSNRVMRCYKSPGR